MAWISVGQELLGANLPYLQWRLGVSRNEVLGMLLGLWLWAIGNADPSGLLVGCNRQSMAGVLAIGACPNYRPEDAVDALVEQGWLAETNTGEIRISSWENLRKYYDRYITLLERNRNRTNEWRARKTEGELHESDDGQITLFELEEPVKSSDGKNKRNKYTEDFEQFWKIYPRKVDKGQAYRKYCARIHEGHKPKELMQAAKNYAEDCKRNRTMMPYIKHAKTFLGESEPYLEWVERRPEIPQQTQWRPDYNPFDE